MKYFTNIWTSTVKEKKKACVHFSFFIMKLKVASRFSGRSERSKKPAKRKTNFEIEKKERKPPKTIEKNWIIWRFERNDCCIISINDHLIFSVNIQINEKITKRNLLPFNLKQSSQFHSAFLLQFCILGKKK